MKLPQKNFLEIIDQTPLVAIDLIIKNSKGEILLGVRNNKPAQGFWFVPGGRIRKNETIKEAFERVIFEETGVNISYQETKLIGAYDHIYDDNFADKKGLGTHYVVLGHEVAISENIAIINDKQHSEFKWWKMEELLKSELVHQNTKNYFL